MRIYRRGLGREVLTLMIEKGLINNQAKKSKYRQTTLSEF